MCLVAKAHVIGTLPPCGMQSGLPARVNSFGNDAAIRNKRAAFWQSCATVSSSLNLIAPGIQSPTIRSPVLHSLRANRVDSIARRLSSLAPISGQAVPAEVCRGTFPSRILAFFGSEPCFAANAVRNLDMPGLRLPLS